ncbi:protein translocase subunit SecD [Ornithinimicrobium sp. Y1847]|uniref:protein translocase subunit SecD n=1 Tax=Ornithinimicrobium sp. Y1847 TaxID=3405419 RepID=UPI003B67B835
MSTSIPGRRQEEDLPGLSRDSGRRQRGSSQRQRTKKVSSRRARMKGPARTLLALLVLTLALFGGLGAAHLFADPKAELTPQLGLDLAGGRQVVLAPKTEGGQAINPANLDQAIDIIRRRVDGTGTAEAEVSRLGNNVQVAIPGNPTPAQLEALSRSSQMNFRPVLIAMPIGIEDPQAPPRELPLPSEQLRDQVEQMQGPPAGIEDGVTDSTTGDGATDTESDVPSVDEAEQTDENRGGERLPMTSTAGPDDAEQTTAPGEEAPAPVVTDPSSLDQITPELQQEFFEADCSPGPAGEAIAEAASNAPSGQPLVACNEEGTEKYILGPVELSGSNLTDANAGLQQLQQGVVTGAWEVILNFDTEGGQRFDEITRRLMGYPQGAAQNRFAMVLDGAVISAPTVNSVISNGVATISGSFDSESAETLANQLKFGALPMSFDVQTSEQISPTLGGTQLRWGLIAGAIGLLLVFIFMLIQYHALGFVAIGSLIVAALLTYGAVTLLGWATNFRLTMAGVTGLIVAIGITADSFIVYFERIRDEVRAGRPLRYAVDTGWDRARRTIIISDVVNLIAAGVLYYLSESSVKAFAFTLGLTTILDLVIVIMFTHPVVSILANTTFFGEGRKWSGMEPERLGAKRSTYLGRGQVREPAVITPGRRRHTREELEGGVV